MARGRKPKKSQAEIVAELEAEIQRRKALMEADKYRENPIFSALMNASASVGTIGISPEKSALEKQTANNYRVKAAWKDAEAAVTVPSDIKIGELAKAYSNLAEKVLVMLVEGKTEKDINAFVKKEKAKILESEEAKAYQNTAQLELKAAEAYFQVAAITGNASKVSNATDRLNAAKALCGEKS